MSPDRTTICAKNFLGRWLLFSTVLVLTMLPCSVRSQLTSRTGDVKTNGNCNQTATGYNNTFIVTCTIQGMDSSRVIKALNQLLGDSKHLDERLDNLEKIIIAPPQVPLTVEFFGPSEVSFAVTNPSDQVLSNVVSTLMLFRTSDLALFSYAAQSHGFIKPHSRSGNYLIDLVNTPKAFTPAHLEEGDELIGFFSVDCPTCMGQHYIMHLSYRKSGWTADSHALANLAASFQPGEDERSTIAHILAIPAAQRHQLTNYTGIVLVPEASRQAGWITSAGAIRGQAMYVGLRNMPERKGVTTLDGRPWDEDQFEDIRLDVRNDSDLLLQNVDLTLTFSKDPVRLFGAIGQLSRLTGVDFTSDSVQGPTVRLKGNDGKTYNLPFPDMHFPPTSYKVFVPRLEAHGTVRLIIGAVGPAPRDPPRELKIAGSAESMAAERSQKIVINETVPIAQ